MSGIVSWVGKHTVLLAVIGLPVLIFLWWWFRPEKLWVNQQVNEPAPGAISGDAQPVFTGKLAGELHKTSGRATIYKNASGMEYLRLTDFMTSNGPDVHVLLAQSGDANLKQDVIKGQLDSVELGPLKGNQGDQNYDLPATADLQKYNAVVIYCERFHAVFGVAPLETF
jgi:hypothetical protein